MAKHKSTEGLPAGAMQAIIDSALEVLASDAPGMRWPGAAARLATTC